MAENPRIEELRRRVQADPASIAFAALAEEFRRLGRYDEAIETCRAGLVRHPAYLSARVTLGRALIEAGDFEGAREELQIVLRSAPENLAAIRGLEQIHERLGHSTVIDPALAAMAHAIPVREPAPVAPPPPSFEPIGARPEAPVESVPEPLFTGPECEPVQEVPEPTTVEAPPAPSPIEQIPEPAIVEAAPQPSPIEEIPEPAIVEAAPEPSGIEEVPAPTNVEGACEPAPIEQLPEPSISEVSREPSIVEDMPLVASAPSVEAAPLHVEEPYVDFPLADLPEMNPRPSDLPDPAVAATLVRLEQFLAAVQHARHA
jgi:hypothetical protein